MATPAEESSLNNNIQISFFNNSGFFFICTSKNKKGYLAKMLLFFTAFFTNQFSTLILAACLDDSHHCLMICKVCDDYYPNQTMTCLSALYEHYLLQFNDGMESLNNTDWCVWDKVNRWINCVISLLKKYFVVLRSLMLSLSAVCIAD